MSIEVIGLRKFLQMIMADPKHLTRLLRENIRGEIRKEVAETSPGGDFHSAFWADAKSHAVGVLDLRRATDGRVDAHLGRARLYPLLTQGFLLWWEERRRRRNEPFVVERSSVKGRLPVGELGIIKVENNLAFSIGEDGYRVVYPYFSESPALTPDAARLGLWVMENALPDYDPADLRILDVLRGLSFSAQEVAFTGGEEGEIRAHYRRLLERCRELRAEY